MPVPESSAADPRNSARRDGSRPVLGHVNLMVDTLIANANLEDLRAIVRGMLATSPPSAAQAFTGAARQRLQRTNAAAVPDDIAGVFDAGDGSDAAPTAALAAVLVRTRALYGSGLGFASLRILAAVVRATVGLRWPEGGPMEDSLALVDADISQAIQSAKEERDGGRAEDVQAARAVVQELREAVAESQLDARKWAGAFAFERAAASLEHWRL
ncbi:uncharacterized protein BXZ73DRAFT_78714 [Epithele typhae]|uniref:uncharacterized protein n=1 Tax=Epithele typhae TaxID=378194 RepID=UPI0020077565|nr:uncharacterized protein BXZ73DRAFT_78714 [Epithele typhae]KAH9926620.1 hypothetical protein BXZ73DRAFT_78714 [Epithele typhae]